MGPSIRKSSSGGPVNTKAFIRWAREYESLLPRGPSIQKPSSGGPVNAKAFIQRARPHESLHPMGPSRQKPDDDGDGDDVGDDGCSSSISIYTNSRSTALAAGTCYESTRNAPFHPVAFTLQCRRLQLLLVFGF